HSFTFTLYIAHTMASADLRDELTCSICLNIYTDPVTLPCGHSFCRTCIGDVLDTQEGSGAYKCPECRAESQERPALVKNRKLRNIAENIQSTHPEQEEAGIPSSLEEAEKRVQNLEELRRQVQGKAAGVTERLTALIRDIRKQLEALEKRVLSEISGRKSRSHSESQI
uniref:RING-type domain-containing protein n=1 Tax=Leptobrachium leishanense TaxID=445787 RepID=A0A8C5Q4T1_9ANUR